MQTVIAAHIAGKNVQDNYLFILLQKIATQYPTTKVLLFCSENINTTINNIEVQTSSKKNIIAKAYWYKYTLPKLVQKAHCFITNEKLCIASKIPQYFFITEDITNAKTKYFQNIKTAKNIFVAIQFFEDYVAQFLPSEKPINLNLGSRTAPLALSYNQVKSIQGEFTNGYDYFLFFVNEATKNNIITVLKAFSILKKWQKTSMKLLLLLDNISEVDLISDFKNYKHKDDVVFVKSIKENNENIISAAFACLYFSTYNNIQSAFVALQNFVPIIASDTSLHKSVFKNAVLYTNCTEKNIAENMQQLYKDENLKKELLAEANIVLQKYNTDKAAAKLYDIISAK